MKDVNRITICKDNFKTQEEFENEIKKTVMVLLDNYYIMTVKYNAGKGMGIVVIDYNYANKTYGTDYPYWLSPSEIESVIEDD